MLEMFSNPKRKKKMWGA